MQPRIAFRTHYQVDEPAYLEFLVKLCTSPVRSAYREVVAQKLADEVARRGKEFNTAAGEYAVDLAKDLGLITENHTWTDGGHLVNLVAQTNEGVWEQQLPLTLPEKLLHLRTFLEGDGAALVFLARRMVETRSPVTADTTWNALAKDMFVEVFSNYLAITNNTADRVKLRREIERLRAAEYKGNTGPHKVFVHLQVLYRLSLIERVDGVRSRIYQIPQTPRRTHCGLVVFTETIPDVAGLELVLKDHKWIEVAAKVLQIDATPWTATSDLAPLVAPHYERIMATGAPLCPISTLMEAVQIELLSQESRLLPWSKAVEAMERLQKQHPKDIRFHVDRRGQPAFVKMSDAFLADCVEQKVAR
jgi:hypothetical protein